MCVLLVNIAEIRSIQECFAKDPAKGKFQTYRNSLLLQGVPTLFLPTISRERLLNLHQIQITRILPTEFFLPLFLLLIIYQPSPITRNMNTEFQKLKRRKETERKLQGNYIQF